MESNQLKNDELECSEAVRQVLNERHGKNISKEQVEKILELSELLLEIAKGEFECKTCKEKYKIYGVPFKK